MSSRSEARDVLNVLIAWSGVVLHEFIPPGGLTAVVEFSRHSEPPRWIQPPEPGCYQEVYIFDRHVVTALTQRRVAQELRKMGVEGKTLFAGTCRGRMGFMHQDFVIHEGRLTPRSSVPEPEGLLDRYLVGLVGLPASGKSFLRRVLEGLAREKDRELQGAFSAYKWSDAFMAELQDRLGRPSTPKELMEAGWRFYQEVESKNPLVVAERFLELENRRAMQDRARFLVVEGFKNLDAARYVSRCLDRPLILIAIHREEEERKREVANRKHPDDFFDEERLKLLRAMGVEEIIAAADFRIDTTGCRIEYDNKEGACRIRLTRRFLDDLWEALGWILCLPESKRPRLEKRVTRAIGRIAKEKGFSPDVQILER